jgi:5-methylcytosine-specific restriction protein A
MAKLKALKSPIRRLASPLGRLTDGHGHSRALEPWRKWYCLKAWEVLRQEVFARDQFVCQCGCDKLIVNPRERIADHKDAHRGDWNMFFDPDNVQTLWKPHHDGWKQRLERAARGRGG